MTQAEYQPETAAQVRADTAAYNAEKMAPQGADTAANVPICVHGDDAEACQLRHDDTLHVSTPRARVIAAIHAYADWLAEHPEIPVPHSVNATAYFDGGPTALAAWSAANDFTVYPKMPNISTLTVIDYDAHTVRIAHSMYGDES
jgi:hypothetical protein